MDRYDERNAPLRAGARNLGDLPELHASEPMSRLVAYSSPYIFWATVVSLSMGIVLLQ